MVSGGNERRVHLPKFQPTLDIDEFNALTDLLFELMREKHQACAKLLGVSTPTWRKWETEPPTWPWWNIVLRHAIKEYLSHINAKRSITAKHKRRILNSLAQIPDGQQILEDIALLSANISSAQDHLRRVLSSKGMFLDELRKPGNSGGFSEKTLRRAAKSLGVVKTQEGYGDHKRSFWRLPTADDD